MLLARPGLGELRFGELAGNAARCPDLAGISQLRLQQRAECGGRLARPSFPDIALPLVFNDSRVHIEAVYCRTEGQSYG
jgi:hypothetical protein